MNKPILLKIDQKEDRATVAEILFRNGYRVEPARVKVKKSYQYLVKCEPLECLDIVIPEEGKDET